MGKRGPRNPPLSVLPSLARDARERPAVPPEWLILTESEAAAILKCSPQTLRRRAKSGEFPRYLVGGEYRYYVYDLIDYALRERIES